ncbi:oligosaccharide flippase family protein [Psychroflexus salinarum]|uniref:Oligosaccharide flippase family protein n=1 Tax=Psychroflexus salinarum TaxID=546024 RepID=A0ABW3GQB9_9FLAO
MIRRLQNTLKDSDFKEILTKGFSFLLIRIVGTLLSFAFTFYITNTYGKVEWGLIALGFSIFTIISIFGRLGLDSNLVKFYSQYENLQDTGVFYWAWLKVFLFSTLLSLIVYNFGEALVTDVFLKPKPELLPYLNWLLPSIPFWTTVFVSAAIMRARKMNRAFAFYTLVGRFGILLLIILLMAHDNVLFIIKSHFFGLICLSMMSLVHAILILKKPTFKTDQNTWGFVKEALPMMLSSSILVLMSWMDTFVMGVYENEADVGIYSVAVKITTLTTFSLQAINSILAPKIAKSYANNETINYKKFIQFSTKINFIMTFVVVGFIVILSPYLLGLFGQGFEAGVSVLIILCAGQMINSLSGSVGVVMQMIGEQKMFQNFMVSALIINLILTLILTPKYGGSGAATATVLSMIFWNIAGATYLKKKKNIQTYFKPF